MISRSMKGLAGWLLAAAGRVSALLAAVVLSRRLGRAEERKKAHEHAVSQARRALEIDYEVSRLDPASVDRRLRRFYRR